MKAIDFPGVNCVLAKDQPEYVPLPVRRDDGPEGQVVACFELDADERAAIQEHGKIWYLQWTFGNPFQPMLLQVEGAQKPLDSPGPRPKEQRFVLDPESGFVWDRVEGEWLHDAREVLERIEPVLCDPGDLAEEPSVSHEPDLGEWLGEVATQTLENSANGKSGRTDELMLGKFQEVLLAVEMACKHANGKITYRLMELCDEAKALINVAPTERRDQATFGEADGCNQKGVA